MIDQGAFMEAHDCHYGTPLHVACARQHYDCAKVLLKAGEVIFDFFDFLKDSLVTLSILLNYLT